MESKVLNLKQVPSPILISEPVGELALEIPAGITHYHLSQTASTAKLSFHLRVPGSTLILTGSVLAEGSSTPTLATEIIHHVPETRAETRVRTLARDTSAPRFTGLIRIEPAATGCESYLNHHSLLLGETAKSWTHPSLEILNNDVRCSHAATVRTLSDLDVFYLRSRGLSEADARETLINAFFADVSF